jgi:hypothetical protein
MRPCALREHRLRRRPATPPPPPLRVPGGRYGRPACDRTVSQLSTRSGTGVPKRLRECASRDGGVQPLAPAGREFARVCR